MHNLEFYDNNNVLWVQVQKKSAEKLYNKCYDVCICASNLRPFNFWKCGCIVNISREYGYFSNICNNYQYYNCINAETGTYLRYYVKNDDLIKYKNEK